MTGVGKFQPAIVLNTAHGPSVWNNNTVAGQVNLPQGWSKRKQHQHTARITLDLYLLGKRGSWCVLHKTYNKKWGGWSDDCSSRVNMIYIFLVPKWRVERAEV